MKTTKSFTLHNVEPELYTALLVAAEARGTSLNRVAKAMLRTASGLTTAKKKRDLSWLHSNKWSQSEAEAFDKAIAGTETITPGDW